MEPSSRPPVMQPGESFVVGNIRFTVCPLMDAAAWVINVAQAPAARAQRGGKGMSIHFCNAFNVALARADSNYAHLLAQGDAVFSDGVPITWVGKRAYPEQTGKWERVYGPDVMRLVLGQSGSEGPRHYLLGSTPETLEALVRSIGTQFPNAQVVGIESPPFRPATVEELALRDARIVQSGADIVWVGLGTPKQDYEAQRLANSIPVLAMAVGAAFDFLAGTKTQAPKWVQRAGLEWAFRLASEPKRLGARYFWGNSVFALEAMRTIRTNRNSKNSF